MAYGKLDRLIAAVDDFVAASSEVELPLLRNFAANWERIRYKYATPLPGVTKSALAGGIEQGLREMPILFERADSAMRIELSKMLNLAISVHYPELEKNDSMVFDRIKARGKIRTEREYYLIRYFLDKHEGEVHPEINVAELYNLIDLYEAKG